MAAETPASPPHSGCGVSLTPRVSIIMPFLNSEQFLEEAIASVLAQCYPHWELLLVDDGSTDGSTLIALDYAERHPTKIRYLQHEGHRRCGASAARNLALQHASGEYIALLDSDDVWLPRKLTEQVALLDRHPRADLLYGRTEYWRSWSSSESDTAGDSLNDLGLELDRMHRLRERYSDFFFFPKITTPCTCSILIRKRAIDRAGGFEVRFRDVFTDQCLYAKLFLNANAFVSSSAWDRYRQHPDSSCHKADGQETLSSTRLRFLKWLIRHLDASESPKALRRGARHAYWAHKASRIPPIALLIRVLRRVSRLTKSIPVGIR